MYIACEETLTAWSWINIHDCVYDAQKRACCIII